MAQTQQDYHNYQTNPPFSTSATHSSFFPEKAPSASQVLALATLLPLGAFLLLLAGLTLTGTVVGLAVASPLFFIFSPVLLPAALVIVLAVAGFLTSGAFGVTALSSFTWLANYLRRSRLPEQLQYAKRRAQETMGQVTQSIKEAGEAVQSKIQDATQEAQAQAQTQESGQKAQNNKTRTKTQVEKTTS